MAAYKQNVPVLKLSSQMALFTLPQKVFIIKCYYKTGQSPNTVLECLGRRYGIKYNSENLKAISQIVLAFETTGSVLNRYYCNTAIDIRTKVVRNVPVTIRKATATGPPPKLQLRKPPKVETQSHTHGTTTADGAEDIIMIEMGEDGVEVLTEYAETMEHVVAHQDTISGDEEATEVEVVVEETEKAPSANEPRKQCQECGVYVSRALWPRHQRKHREENKIFQCEECNLVFITKELLFKHMKEHRPMYICEICGKVSRTTTTHRAHMLTHSDVKAHTCGVCQKQFRRREGLRRHELTHTGNKPYVCEHCNARFSQFMGWQMHVRLHTGERPYECKHCDKRFVGQPALNTHLKSHVGEYMFACSICQGRYKTEKTLKEHIQVKHDISEESLK